MNEKTKRVLYIITITIGFSAALILADCITNLTGVH